MTEKNYNKISEKIHSLKESIPFLKNKSDEYVFTALCIKANFFKNPSFDYDEKVIEDMIVDGVNDGGVDAILSDPNSETSNLVLCQSKFYKNITFDEVRNAVLKMILFYKEMQRGNYETVNQAVRGRFLSLNAEVGEESKVYFVFYTSADKNGIRRDRINKLLSEFGLDNSIYEIILLFSDDLLEEIKESESRRPTVESGKITIDKSNNVLYYGDSSAIVNVSAFSIKELYSEHNINLLARNLRYFIKKGDIDKSINETIACSPETFWFKNNGITIVCDNFEVDGKHIRLKDFSIVNGGQTTHLISKSKSINVYNDLFLPCKIIKTSGVDEREKNQFSLEIAKATNSQKAIKNIDLKANAPEQIQFGRELREIQVYYQTKRGENIPKDYKGASQNTDLAAAGKLGLAGIFQMPGSSRSKPSSLYKDSFYNPLFNGNQKQVAGVVKDLLYVNEYFSRFVKQYEKDMSEQALASTLIPFANNSRTICIAFTALASRYYQKNLSEEDMSMVFNHLNKDKAYDDYFYEIFKDLGDVKRIFPNGSYENKDKLDNALYKLFDIIIKSGCRYYQRKKDDDNTLNESNFLKKDANYYSILRDSWFDIPQKINEIFSSL